MSGVQCYVPRTGLYDHNWFLFSRENLDYTIERHKNNYPIGTFKEFWYCTRCRYEEERVVEDVRLT